MILPGTKLSWAPWQDLTWNQTFSGSLAGSYLEPNFHGLLGRIVPGTKLSWAPCIRILPRTKRSWVPWHLAGSYLKPNFHGLLGRILPGTKLSWAPWQDLTWNQTVKGSSAVSYLKPNFHGLLHLFGELPVTLHPHLDVVLLVEVGAAKVILREVHLDRSWDKQKKKNKMAASKLKPADNLKGQGFDFFGLATNSENYLRFKMSSGPSPFSRRLTVSCRAIASIRSSPADRKEICHVCSVRKTGNRFITHISIKCTSMFFLSHSWVYSNVCVKWTHSYL